MATFFDESYYLKSKLAQLKSVGEKDANGNDYTLDTLLKAISDAGMTPETHYQLHGRAEQLNPNAYFNEAEYLQAKLNQLKSVGEKDENGNDFTLDTLVKAIEGIGLSVAEHYERFGSHETDANGNLINPSNAFDANAYVVAKLYQLQTSGTDAEKAEWAGKTAADVVAAIAENGMSPVSHYEMFGATEANAGDVPLVQTVPVTQRVENDPARAEVTGELVPSNYNAPTPPPAAVTADKAAPVAKPADVGGKADAAISPEVTPPAKPVPVPGDPDYVAPPANIVDTNDNPVVVVPPATAGDKPQFGVVNDNGTISGVDGNGNPTDTVIGKVDDTGTVKPVDPTPEPTPDPTPDTTPPAAPTFADNIAGDKVIDMGEAHKDVLLTGRAEAGSAVKITVTDSTTAHSVVLNGNADAAGNFSIALPQADIAQFVDGALTLSAVATDAAGNISKAGTASITLDADADATITHNESFGYDTPKELENAALGNPFDPEGTGLFSELRKVWDAGTKADSKSLSLEQIKELAPSVYDKLVHFSESGQSHMANQSAPDGHDYLNLSVHDVYGGGLALKLADLNEAFQAAGTGNNVQIALSALLNVLGKAYFDVPTIEATAKDVVNLEVDKVGSITGAFTADKLNHDLTFSSLVQLVSEVKPIAVDVHTAETLDIHLADSGNSSIVNMMEVRGDVTNITFSGTKGLFGLNIDARATESDSTSGHVKSIDASSLTDSANSGVYINTAPISISLDDLFSKGVNATVADGLTFKGSAGDDILVMTQDKYAKAETLDGGKNTTTGGDTLGLIINGTAGQQTEVSANAKMTGFENVAFVSFALDTDANGSVENLQFKADALSFALKGVQHFITSNDLTLTNYGGQTVTVVGGLDSEVKLDLGGTGTAATINLAMTSNFLTPQLGLGVGRAVLTNADNITGLTLKGADANADILLTSAALEDLNGGTIDVSGYAGDIQYQSGWQITVSSSECTLASNGTTVTLSGVQTGTDISVAADYSA